MKKINVLVSGVGGDVAQGIIKSLEASSLNLNIFKTCISEYSSWLHKDNNSYIVPYSNDEKYIPTLIKIFEKEKIDIFIPAVDSEIELISENKDYIESKTNIKVFTDDISKIRYCDDKYLTFKFLFENSFPTPLTVVPENRDIIDSFLEKVNFPIISKPRSGRGAVNIKLHKTKEELYSLIGDDSLILQEYLEGEEYTSGIYLGEDNEVKGICTLKRKLKNGSTYQAQRIIDKELESGLELIAKKLGIKYLNIQSKLVNGKFVPFEFNGRFSGTTGIISRVFNAPEMYIREVYLNEKINRTYNDETFHVMRFYDEVYTDNDSMEKLKNRSREL